MQITKVNVVIEKIDRATAERYLASSKGNCRFIPRRIRILATLVHRDLWKPLAGKGLGFDVNESLVDGHHSLMAFLSTSKPFFFVKVTRGIPVEDCDTLDVGHSPRLLPQVLSFAHPSMTNATLRVACVRLCTYLLTSKNVPIEEPNDYEQWNRLFKPGVNWAIETMTSSPLVGKAYIMGALAFAHKSDPEKIEKFGASLVNQTGLVEGSPVLCVIKSLQLHRVGQDNEEGCRKARSSNTQGRKMSHKILNASLAFLEGRTLAHLQPGFKGMEYFRAAYHSKSLEQLTFAWKKPEEDIQLAEGEETVPDIQTYRIGKKEVQVASLFRSEIGAVKRKAKP